MLPKTRVLLSLFVMALAAGALLLSQAWSIRTAMFPRAVGIPLFFLAAAEFVFSLREGAAPTGGAAMDFELSAGVLPRVALQRTLGIFAWIVGFFVAIVLLGFPIAIPLFIFAYLRGEGRERWIITLVLMALAWLLFDGLFVRLLHIPFPRGLLLQILD